MSDHLLLARPEVMLNGADGDNTYRLIVWQYLDYEVYCVNSTYVIIGMIEILSENQLYFHYWYDSCDWHLIVVHKLHLRLESIVHYFHDYFDGCVGCI